MKKVAFLFSMIVCFFTSCTTGKGLVEYTEARNYFHRNDAAIPQDLKITSQAEFDKQFSAAAFMGEKGKVTKIDFSKEFVIAKVLPVTDKETILKPIRLVENGKDKLQLFYSLKEGKQQSYFTQPMFILIVGNKYKSYSIQEVAK